MYIINMLIEDYTQRIKCEDINTATAWAIIKALYEDCTSADEPIWVYFSDTDTEAEKLRETEACFCITYTDSISYLKTKFEKAVRTAKEG